MAVVFGGVAALLAPWIVVLYSTQADVGTSDDLAFASAGILAALGLGLAASAVTCWRGSRYVVVPVTFSGVLAATTGFFHIVTGTAASFIVAIISSALIFVPVVLLCGWVAVTHGPPHHGSPTPRWVPLAFGAATVAMVPALVRAVVTSPIAVQPASHLRLTWTTLDVVELMAIVALAVALWRRSAAVAVAAIATSALLVSDVWFNVVATTGDTRTSGLLMSAVSVPIAALAVVVAVHAVRSPSASRSA